MTSLYFHPEAYSTTGPKLMGRNAAGESFLKGYLRYGKSPQIVAQILQAAHRQPLEEAVLAHAPHKRLITFANQDLGVLKDHGVSYYPGPGIGEHAWHRSFYGHGRWSLCGITHTTSSATAMDALAELLVAPVQPWDALICTSQAVKRNVESVLQAQVDYLKDRLGITKIVLPALPVIALGVHSDEFMFTERQKNSARQALGITPNATVVLYLGRLSFHAKAHPLAMYQALAQALPKNGSPEVVLIECGWHANDHIANAYRQAAQLACPAVRVLTLDGRDTTIRSQAWQSADIFCSLSDNIQETFGITPIEAMASRLPVIVSDWDGYKDTVRDGEDGFRIATTMPGPGLGGDLASRHARGVDTYDMYCGYTSSLISVDIAQCAAAFSRLITDAALRRTMGTNAQARVRSHFDWSIIIAQYEDLWLQLNKIRARAVIGNLALNQPANWPARLDPFVSFAHYATQTINLDKKLSPQHDTLSESLTHFDRLSSLTMVSYTEPLLLTRDEVLEVLTQVHQGIRKLSEVVSVIPKARQAFVLRGIGWLAKLGIVQIHT